MMASPSIGTVEYMVLASWSVDAEEYGASDQIDYRAVEGDGGNDDDQEDPLESLSAGHGSLEEAHQLGSDEHHHDHDEAALGSRLQGRIPGREQPITVITVMHMLITLSDVEGRTVGTGENV